MRKKLCMVILLLFIATNAFGYWGNRTTEEVIEYISTVIDLSDKTVCDIGSAEGNVMIEFAEYAKAVKGIEQNSGIAPLSRSRRDRRGRPLNVTQGNALTDTLPEADVYYVWLGNNEIAEIIERVVTDDIKKIFIIGNYSNYIYKEYFRLMGMQKHTVRTWRGDFDIYIWDRT